MLHALIFSPAAEKSRLNWAMQVKVVSGEEGEMAWQIGETALFSVTFGRWPDILYKIDMESDHTLLSRYAEADDEAAFAELVRRHMDFVYSAALRQVAGDTHLAQDVAQRTFTTLARKAGTLSGRSCLLGWLHTTTRYTASVAVRSEQRRRAHERAALAMDKIASEPELDWGQMQPVLDDAVGQLGEQDRAAVLLRFFKDKSHREVALELGVNEALVRKRVDRALEKLRGHLMRRGVISSSVVVAAGITANSVRAAPVGLAARMGVASLREAARVGILESLWQMLTHTARAKAMLVATLVLGASAIPFTLQSLQIGQVNVENAELIRQNAALQSEAGRLRNQLQAANTLAPGAVSRPLAVGAGFIPVSLDFLKQLPWGLSLTIPTTTNRYLVAEGGLLGVTPEEAKRAQVVIDEVKNRVQTYALNNIREIPLNEVRDETTLDFLKAYPGTQSVYEISPMSDAELAEYTDWFSRSLTDVLGPDRAEIVVKTYRGRPGYSTSLFDYLWLKPHLHYRFAFSDYFDADGQIQTAWSIFSGVGESGSAGGPINSDDPIPDEWAFLFKRSNETNNPPSKQAGANQPSAKTFP